MYQLNKLNKANSSTPILILAFLLCAAGFAQANNHANDQNLDANQLELLAEQSDISAQYELGVIYAEGESIDKNRTKLNIT